MRSHSGSRSKFLTNSRSFVGSVPWGLLFVYLNDFLTQEKSMSTNDATLVIGVFGAGGERAK